ncbi:hypothetical protein [Riemerella anatipestifer]|uniref:Uncharacterized protein n=1 Tax=Riemerella anatipestifer RA-CH-1 TaxID=1228997 RepID=J9R0P6_RIEAN|nr:hypothetical protein [Riemerella anatipestifer]AFR36565.1 hypothetical protein B739_1983 [Riemerella anatipestifer RA-CH-1]MCO7331401.1 hypothetical protein [Riemerella anatipestifer]MCO7350128.1 hypothetical protein [Riemerella anatipestifer]MCU7582197.1 hypothetical protein [Riemerella anatipestifer]MCW0485266.1 hypothetical protein [Riemerella anatipestifer]
MIRLTPKNPDIIKMEITTNIPQMDIIQFLQKRGYEVKAFVYREPAEQGFLIDEPPFEWHTFTATKEGEAQSKDNLFLNVFEKEVKKLLKEFMSF